MHGDLLEPDLPPDDEEDFPLDEERDRPEADDGIEGPEHLGLTPSD